MLVATVIVGEQFVMLRRDEVAMWRVVSLIWREVGLCGGNISDTAGGGYVGEHR